VLCNNLHILLNTNIILIHCLNLWLGIHGASNEIYIDSELPQLIVTNTGIVKLSMYVAPSWNWECTRFHVELRIGDKILNMF
jgi:hypothetical protein